MKALVLSSGGVDSTTLLAMACDRYGSDNVVSMSVYYGQKHSKELEAAQKVAEHYGVRHITSDLSEIFSSSDCTLLKGRGDIPHESYAEQLKKTDGSPVSTYVPFRNGLFLSAAASAALSEGCGVLMYGAHADDAAGSAYPDCSEEFVEAMAKAISLGTGGTLTLEAPFAKLNKKQVVAIGVRLNVPYELTWSCYEGADEPCLKCATCIDRIAAFRANGLTIN
ncbi:MAG: 7-cyano-7-deazaguanine synthase QueC [Oscillospiraceae bacterium]|nr:7-cyano-7-deazaguanine synthase QueC [Oscillospiraceae bacterium]MBQ8978832.1 7-cyano-7-deazaguanine synthase QueC [Oscillospiraceae bacterium]